MAKRYYVRASINGSEPILCARPYPRSDNHLDAYGYPCRIEALEFARTMAGRFPDNAYSVTED